MPPKGHEVDARLHTDGTPAPASGTDPGAADARSAGPGATQSGPDAAAIAREQQRLRRACKIDSLTTMATGVAHDFNNYLAAILGNNSILSRSVPPGSPNAEHLQQIDSTARHALELTTQILDFSAHGPLNETLLNISDLVRELMPQLAISVSRRVRVECELDDAVPAVPADWAQIRQVVLNLVINASEAIIDKDGRVTLSTGVRDCDRDWIANTYLDEGQPAGPYVFITVSDNGCGIGPNVEDRMFDPFFTTKIRGQGMGLAAVLGIVRSHGGAISFSSRVGQGSTFSVFLPSNRRSRRTL